MDAGSKRFLWSVLRRRTALQLFVELLEAELRVGSHPFRFLAPKDLARVAAASRAFHGGFDYGKVRGLVATYVSDVCEALDLQRSARTDHGEP